MSPSSAHPRKRVKRIASAAVAGPERAKSAPLAATVRQAIGQFVRLLSRSGVATDGIREEVLRACRTAPTKRTRAGLSQEINDASHVMTLWFSDPAYTDKRGSPRALPLRGAALSIEGLVRRVDPRLDVRNVLRYLERGRALRRVGARYAPRQQTLMFTQADDLSVTLEGLFGLLRTLAGDMHGSQGRRRRLQVFAFNPRFPASGVAGFGRRIRPLVHRLLVQADDDMHLRELGRKPREPTVRMGLGVYQFVVRPRPPTAKRRRGKAAKR